MKKLARYNVYVTGDIGEGGIDYHDDKCEDGRFVLYTDYAALQAKLTEAEARVAVLEAEFKSEKEASEAISNALIKALSSLAPAGEVERRVPGADRGMGCEMEDASRYAGFGDESVLRTYVAYTDYAALQAKLTEAEARVAEWSRYSQHKSTCRNWAEIGVCTCGLNALRAALTGVQEEKP